MKGYGKYRFTDDLDSVSQDPKIRKVLYINVSDAVPEKAKILKTFHYPDGYNRLTAYTL